MRPALFSYFRVGLSGCGLLWVAACTDAYLPEEIKSPPGYLVVDGFINPAGVSSFRLSRSYAISSPAAPPPETKAVAYVEEEAGPRYVLREAAGGVYASAGALSLNPAKRYRLHVNTQGGKEYASDYVPVKLTPPIDDVAWKADNSKLSIYVNAHDATRRTEYYRWETTETWEITPPYRPTVEYVKNVMRDIVVPYPTICYGNTPSYTILLDKTTALSQDVVANYRLRELPSTSERLSTRYSMLVQQHALTKEEYGYWDLLRKNTEAIGTLFDPQPAQLTGNVHCLSNPADLALGYVGAHSLAEKRIFIRRADLPAQWRVPTGYERCVPPDTVFLYRLSPPPPITETLSVAFYDQTYLPINPLISYTSLILYGYTAKPRDCVDCRTRGSAVRPSFW
jgi:hypothetical protein